MTHEDVIKQLESLIDNSKSFITAHNGPEDNAIWEADIEALTIAIEAVKKVEDTKVWLHLVKNILPTDRSAYQQGRYALAHTLLNRLKP